MNITAKSIIGVILVLLITFASISVCQNIGKFIKVDVTQRNLYTLSEGTKSILSKLNQPVRVKLYYAETAALKGPDQIRYFGNYYQFVKSILDEYVAASKGMIDLQIIDPRPFSEDEAQALRYGLRRFPITEDESFFFGLVVQTQFGVEKSIPFFSPDRQNFIEYDISYLIDSSVTRQKTRVGIISSLPVMGDDVTGYMAQMMRMQGQQPKPAWTFVEQLKNKFEVKSIETDIEEIKDIDILLVIHPKDFPEKTLFAIDQFVLRNGRAIICVDPHCFADQPDRMAMQSGRMPSQSSNVENILRTWGLKMDAKNFAGDRNLALKASINPNQRPETMIGFLNLVPDCFNRENVITADLNQVRLLFSGVLNEISDTEKEDNSERSSSGTSRTPLLMTTAKGNSWSVSSPFELMALNPTSLMSKFTDGSKPVNMAYLVTGKFDSTFPDGIEVEVEAEGDESEEKSSDEQDNTKKSTKKITGIKKAENDCAVIVFGDVDFISDMVAYQDTFLGKIVVGDNSTLLLNAIDDLTGSSDLISIRSRGNFKRPFIVVDNIEKVAERETAAEEAKINAEIAGFQNELQSIVSSTKESEQDIIGSSILQKKKELELKVHEAQRELRRVKMKRRERIESLGNLLQNFNMLMAPAIILIVAVVLSIRRSAKKRYYINNPR